MTISGILNYRPQTILPPVVDIWRGRAIAKLNYLENRLNVAIPSWSLQSKYDHLVHLVEEKINPLNAWLDDNGNGSLPNKIATALCKLPLRVARNIVMTLAKLIHAILDMLVHPVQSLVHLAKYLVNLLSALGHPQTWAVLGAGMIGASAGQALILATPVGLIAALIGTALVIAGISVEAILAAYHAEAGHRLEVAKDAALYVMSKIPESAATGLVFGVILGAIQKAIIEKQHQTYLQQQKSLLEKRKADLERLLEKQKDAWKELINERKTDLEELLEHEKAILDRKIAFLEKEQFNLEMERVHYSDEKAHLEDDKIHYVYDKVDFERTHRPELTQSEMATATDEVILKIDSWLEENHIPLPSDRILNMHNYLPMDRGPTMIWRGEELELLMKRFPEFKLRGFDQMQLQLFCSDQDVAWVAGKLSGGGRAGWYWQGPGELRLSQSTISPFPYNRVNLWV